MPHPAPVRPGAAGAVDPNILVPTRPEVDS